MTDEKNIKDDEISAPEQPAEAKPASVKEARIRRELEQKITDALDATKNKARFLRERSKIISDKFRNQFKNLENDLNKLLDDLKKEKFFDEDKKAVKKRIEKFDKAVDDITKRIEKVSDRAEAAFEKDITTGEGANAIEEEFEKLVQAAKRAAEAQNIEKPAEIEPAKPKEAEKIPEPPASAEKPAEQPKAETAESIEISQNKLRNIVGYLSDVISDGNADSNYRKWIGILRTRLPEEADESEEMQAKRKLTDDKIFQDNLRAVTKHLKIMRGMDQAGAMVAIKKDKEQEKWRKRKELLDEIFSDEKTEPTKTHGKEKTSEPSKPVTVEKPAEMPKPAHKAETGGKKEEEGEEYPYAEALPSRPVKKGLSAEAGKEEKGITIDTRYFPKAKSELIDEDLKKIMGSTSETGRSVAGDEETVVHSLIEEEKKKKTPAKVKTAQPNIKKNAAKKAIGKVPAAEPSSLPKPPKKAKVEPPPAEETWEKIIATAEQPKKANQPPVKFETPGVQAAYEQMAGSDSTAAPEAESPVLPPVETKKKPWWRRLTEKSVDIGKALRDDPEMRLSVEKCAVEVTYKTAASIVGVKFATDLIGAIPGMINEKWGMGDIHKYKVSDKKMRAEKKEILETFENLINKSKRPETLRLGDQAAEVEAAVQSLREKINQSEHLKQEDRETLLNTLIKVQEEFENAADAAEEARNKRAKELLDTFMQNKVSGWGIAKDALNTALTASGLSLMRGVAYAGTAAAERMQKASAEFNKKREAANAEGEEFRESKLKYILKDLTVNATTETVRALSGKGAKEGEAGKFKKTTDFIKAAGTVARGLGIGYLALSDVSTAEAINNLIAKVEESGIAAAVQENFLHNFERATFHAFSGESQPAAGPSAVHEAAPAPGQTTVHEAPSAVHEAAPAAEATPVLSPGQAEMKSFGLDYTGLDKSTIAETAINLRYLKEMGLSNDAIRSLAADGISKQELASIDNFVKATGGNSMVLSAFSRSIEAGHSPDEVYNSMLVHKGDGIERIIQRQIALNPEKFGFKGDLNDSAAVHKWIGHEASVIAQKQGLDEKYFIFKPNKDQFLILDKDGSFTPIGGELHDEAEIVAAKAREAISAGVAEAQKTAVEGVFGNRGGVDKVIFENYPEAELAEKIGLSDHAERMNAIMEAKGTVSVPAGSEAEAEAAARLADTGKEVGEIGGGLINDSLIFPKNPAYVNEKISQVALEYEAYQQMIAQGRGNSAEAVNLLDKIRGDAGALDHLFKHSGQNLFTEKFVKDIGLEGAPLSEPVEAPAGGGAVEQANQAASGGTEGNEPIESAASNEKADLGVRGAEVVKEIGGAHENIKITYDQSGNVEGIQTTSLESSRALLKQAKDTLINKVEFPKNPFAANNILIELETNDKAYRQLLDWGFKQEAQYLKERNVFLMHHLTHYVSHPADTELYRPDVLNRYGLEPGMSQYGGAHSETLAEAPVGAGVAEQAAPAVEESVSPVAEAVPEAHIGSEPLNEFSDNHGDNIKFEHDASGNVVDVKMSASGGASLNETGEAILNKSVKFTESRPAQGKILVIGVEDRIYQHMVEKGLGNTPEAVALKEKIIGEMRSISRVLTGDKSKLFNQETIARYDLGKPESPEIENMQKVGVDLSPKGAGHAETPDTEVVGSPAEPINEFSGDHGKIEFSHDAAGKVTGLKMDNMPGGSFPEAKARLFNASAQFVPENPHTGRGLSGNIEHLEIYDGLYREMSGKGMINSPEAVHLQKFIAREIQYISKQLDRPLAELYKPETLKMYGLE